MTATKITEKEWQQNDRNALRALRVAIAAILDTRTLEILIINLLTISTSLQLSWGLVFISVIDGPSPTRLRPKGAPETTQDQD